MPREGAHVLGCLNDDLSARGGQRLPEVRAQHHLPPPTPPACLYHPHTCTHIFLILIACARRAQVTSTIDRTTTPANAEAPDVAATTRRCWCLLPSPLHPGPRPPQASTRAPRPHAGAEAFIRQVLVFSCVCVARALGHAVDVRVGVGMPLGVICTALLGFCARLPLSRAVAYGGEPTCEQIRSQHHVAQIITCFSD